MDVGGREMFAYSIWTVCKMPESYPSGEAEQAVRYVCIGLNNEVSPVVKFGVCWYCRGRKNFCLLSFWLSPQEQIQISQRKTGVY